MKRLFKGMIALCALMLLSAAGLFSADAKATTLTCVGLYSETIEGYISARVAGKDWVPVKVGDVLAANAELKINVDRDWIELIPTGNPNSVYEIDGPQSGGDLILKVADILKGKARAVSFPKGTADKPDPKFKDKLVVTKYLGRQIFINSSLDSRDIKYGDVLERKGKVKIIAINNTINLMNASGQTTTVIGPLTFTIDQVLSNANLYKFLNVQK